VTGLEISLPLSSPGFFSEDFPRFVRLWRRIFFCTVIVLLFLHLGFFPDGFPFPPPPVPKLIRKCACGLMAPVPYSQPASTLVELAFSADYWFDFDPPFLAPSLCEFSALGDTHRSFFFRGPNFAPPPKFLSSYFFFGTNSATVSLFKVSLPPLFQQRQYLPPFVLQITFFKFLMPFDVWLFYALL